jgi:hypothetical protein
MEEYRIQGSHATRSERRTHLNELDHPPVDCGCGPDSQANVEAQLWLVAACSHLVRVFQS